jgi:hypothetical protein
VFELSPSRARFVRHGSRSSKVAPATDIPPGSLRPYLPGFRQALVDLGWIEDQALSGQARLSREGYETLRSISSQSTITPETAAIGVLPFNSQSLAGP